MNNDKSCASTNINWARRNLAKPTSNLHKISNEKSPASTSINW